MAVPPPSRLARDRGIRAVVPGAVRPFLYFNHSDGWNQGVRIAELHAIVLKGTLRIDDYPAYTGDRALIDGHYYSEKAPAMVLFALPSFALTVAVQEAVLGVDPDSLSQDGCRSGLPRRPRWVVGGAWRHGAFLPSSGLASMPRPRSWRPLAFSFHHVART